ncbi:MAG: nucleoside triphosphate pyrophosphohydrolase [Acidimicrobiia bacterium]|nr:nucleoside triphosphate pyrophosphohydrolase [Acidimicrobiia bacterium]
MSITIVGLGPAGLDRLTASALAALEDEGATVILRTIDHPAAAELTGRRAVVSCDDLYEAAADYDSLYASVAQRVLDTSGRVVYAVPGSVLVGERAVPLIRQAAAVHARNVVLHPGESFIDLAIAVAGVDPIADGLQVLDARALPDPMPLHLPTLFTQVDTPGTAAELSDELGKLLAHDVELLVMSDLGSGDEAVSTTNVQALSLATVGPRTSVYLAPQEVGWVGLVHTNRVLRAECPWDRKQTHQTLLKHLIEEAYETVDAVAALSAEAPGGEVDYGAYAHVEEELGDLLLQVVFHATMAREAGVFDVEEVAEGIRRKLVSRHPHVFGEVKLDTAAAVEANWERLKSAEKARESAMDDVPSALPALARAEKIQRRAAAVGFDWDSLAPVVAKLREELDELTAAATPESRSAELGDLLFAAVNVARHMSIDAEAAMRSATRRFEARFRWIEEQAGGTEMSKMTLTELDTLWDQAKAAGVGQ